MVEKLKALLTRHRDFILYALFGVLTTAVNYVIYLPLYNLAGLSATLSNGVAWLGAVLAAFLTNKPFVFHSHSWKMETLLPELTRFVGCRIGSGALESAILLVTVDLLQWNGNLMKVATSVLVILLNYIGSKLLVFKK